MSHAKPFGQETRDKKQKAAAKPQDAPDWEAIEREYRAGQLSIRQIARQHGVDEATMRKRAKKNGWTRNLADAVRQEVQAALVRTAYPADLSDEAIVEYAAARGVEVVRQHRGHLGRLQRISANLAEALDSFVGGGELRAGLLGFRESPADVLVKIANATARWMPLEREAFGLNHKQESDVTPKPAAPPLDWRTLFAKAGIAELTDGGVGQAAPLRGLPGGSTALPNDR